MLVCVLASADADDPQQQAAVAEELKKLEGTWTVVAIVQGGMELPAESLGESMTFKKGKLTFRGNSEDAEPEVAHFRLDPACNPKVIDFDDSGNNFKDAEAIVEGVYRLDGDTLLLCINWEGGEAVKGNRPTALESKEGAPARLITMKRQKD
jgi:uncharacterized protein (TIGR03067 family)